MGEYLTLYPTGTPLPLLPAINYRAGRTRANNAIVFLGPAGYLAVRCGQPSGTLHFIFDVNGYFERRHGARSAGARPISAGTLIRIRFR